MRSRSSASLMLICALAGFLMVAGVALVHSVPEPEVHDEFSYLLAADTFSRGRLTNPSHPHWEFFETFHTLSTPTYASKYQPGQGLFLALGVVLGGSPVVGVWLTVAFFGAALYWMLESMIPRRWAVIGTLLALGQFGIGSYWGQSYWGGALPAAGGALVVGAAVRTLTAPRLTVGLMMGIGISLLLLTRPFEGFLVCLVPAAFLASALLRPPLRRRGYFTALGGAALATTACFAWMLHYNHAVTGRALQFPYQMHTQRYMVAPHFLWQRPYAEPSFIHEELRQTATGPELNIYLSQRSLRGLVQTKARLWKANFWFYFGWLLAIPSSIGLAVICRNSRWRIPLLAAAAVGLGTATITWNAVHYTAVAAFIVPLLAVLGLRFICSRLQTRWAGQFLAWGLVVLVGLAGIFSPSSFVHRADAEFTGFRRTITAELESKPGPDLVFVNPGDDYYWEWVYNGAQIDEQSIVWARDMGPAKNQELISYYPDRRVWLLPTPGRKPPQLRPYAQATIPETTR